jgi:AraC-like DNA-binding protein
VEFHYNACYIEKNIGATTMVTSAAAYTKSLLSTALEYCSREGIHPTDLPGFKVIRRDKTTEASPGMYTPIVCLVLQGEKRVWSGKKIYRYNPANYLVSCLDMPATVQVVKASALEPYVGLTLELQPSVVYEILQETSPLKIQSEGPGGGFFVERVTAELADAFARLLKTLEEKNDQKLLAPSIIKEIHYRLMSSRYGSKIRQLGMVGSKTQRISKVLEHLRKDYAAPLSVPDLAKMANMSPSAFHLHFRHVTHMSPLQYQKQIRLQEARRLLSVETIDAASVAYQVGYESPSQFSREYKRLFGQPPMRDVERLREPVPILDAAVG